MIDEIIEKPNPTLAELRLQVPGPARGALPLLLRDARADARRSSTCSTTWSAATSASWAQIQLTTALNALARRERYLALETRGARHNLGVKFGVVEAQIALALAGVDRERMLAALLESIVRIEQNAPADRRRRDRPECWHHLGNAPITKSMSDTPASS